MRNIGKVFRGKTKYIDLDDKPERNFVVVSDNGKSVGVAKLKGYKSEKKGLLKIDHKKYGLNKETGVDYQVFSKNRMSKKKLSLKDKKVFPEGKERFKFSSHDTHKILKHTKRIK